MDFANPDTPGVLHVGDTIKSVVFSGIAQITQGFNEYNADTAYMYAYSGGKHAGYDISGPQFHPDPDTGDYTNPIYTPLAGQVIQAGSSDSYRPNPVMVKTIDDPSTPVNEGGYTIVFGHLWSDTVKVGDTVTAGQQVGFSGEQTIKGTMTPDGTGPHLHFEVWNPENQFVDPEPFLNPDGTSALTSGTPGDGAVAGTPGGTSGGGSGTDWAGVSGAIGNAGARIGVLLVGALVIGFGLVTIVGGKANRPGVPFV